MRSVWNWMPWIRQRLAATPAGRRGVAAVAVALVLAGVAWLVLSGGPRMTPVLDRPWTSAELADVRKALASRGIETQLEGGRLVVPRDRLAEARQILHDEALDADGESASLEQLALKEDVWSSQSQIAKRWQAAKMAAMSRLIRRFPSVRSATVILDEGSRGGLGGPGAVEPTASVGVELKSGCAMTSDLVEAIADLVAGGVAGMKRQNVRVVDSSGRSYRAAEAFGTDTPAARQMVAAEAYFTKKVRSAIPPVGGAVVSVRVEPPADSAALPRCAEARVSLPRSYFVAAARTATGSKRPDEAAVQSATAAGLEQVREMVSAALGEKDGTRLKVDWHYDDAPAVAEAPVSAGTRAESSWTWWGATAGAGAAVGAGLLTLGWRLLRRRRGGSEENAASLQGSGRSAGASRGVLGMLQYASSEDLLALARGEHPQTVAVLLSALPADRAAALLAALPQETQQEVCRRVAALEKIEPAMLCDVEAALAGRLAEVGSERAPAAGGPARLAELLHKAGPQTARAVLESLEKELPGLTESMRQRAMSFEDIATLGESRLGAVLEGMDSRRLAVALRTAPKPLAQKVISCLSAPAARRLKAQMDAVGPVRLSEVEAAQQQIVEELLAGEAGRYAAAKAEQVA